MDRLTSVCLLAACFACSCVPPTPKPPTIVTHTVIAALVDAATKQPIYPGVAYLNGAALGVDAAGHVAFQQVPQGSYTLSGTSADYAPGSTPFDNTQDNQWVTVEMTATWPEPQPRAPLVLEPSDPSGLPCHADPIVTIPDEPDPRFWRAAPWDVTIPGLPFIAGGSSEHPERVLSWFYYRYPSDWQHRILTVNRQWGVTHFVLSWPDARDYGLSLADFRAMRIQIAAAIPYTPTFLLSKDDDPIDVPADQRLAALTPVIDALIADGNTIFMVCWECDLLGRGQYLEDLSTALLDRYPQVDWYWHFTTYKTSWQPDGQPRAQFWQTLAAHHHGPGAIGLLYQGNQNDPCGLMQAHYNDAMVPASGLAAAGALLVPFELVAMNEFTHDHPDAQDAAARGWEVANTPGPLPSAGFSHGATYPDGRPTLKAYR